MDPHSEPAPWEPRRSAPPPRAPMPAPQQQRPMQYGPGPQYGQPGQAGQMYGQYAQPQRPKRRIGLIIGLVVGLPFLMMVGCVGLGLAMNAMADEKPASPADMKYVLQAKEFEPYIEDFKATTTAGKATRIDNIDDSWEISYEYEDDEIYLMSSFIHESSAEDAKYSYSGQQIGTSLGYAGSEVEIEEVERDDLFKWGDESKFYVLQINGQPAGNRLVARKGGNVVYIIFSGVYFDEAEWIHELLDPYLARVGATK